MRSRHLLLAALTIVALVLATTVASAATPPPPGANIPCRPTAAHPSPVVLVHGTFENVRQLAGMSPALKAAGYCVYALDYGNGGRVGDRGLGTSSAAPELSDFVDAVLAPPARARSDGRATRRAG